MHQPPSSLIGDIYDAALDAALWPKVLENTCGYIGASVANLVSENFIRRSASRHYTFGDDPYYTQLYMEKYAALNPLLPSGSFFPEGEVYGQADIIPHEELQQTRIYKEWMKPQGFLDFVACNLEKSATSIAPLVVIRRESDGYVDNEARSRMRELVPHVRRAVLIGKVIESHKVEAVAMAEALDGLAAGIFFVDGVSRIARANVAGHRMIEEGGVLRAPAGRLAANDPVGNKALQDAIAACDAGDAGLGSKGVAISLRAQDGADHVAHVLPLTSAQRLNAGTSLSAVAAVFVRKAELDTRGPIEIFSARHDLTPAEMRVLLAIVNVGSAAEAAELLGIGEGTVRFHLHRLFQKTGASRQADLVRMVAAFASPVGG